MKRHLTEQTVMFFSVVKWTALAMVVGSMVGAAIHYFVVAIDGSSVLVGGLPFNVFLLPIGLLVSTFLIQKFAPNAKGHGTEKVISAVHKKSGKIEAKVVPVKVLATVATIAAGGSVGREGPSAQIGSGIASLVADFLKLDDHDRKKIVVCGISAGFAAIFGTPIGGAIFGVEVLFVGKILYDVLLPSLIAGVTSYEVVVALGTKPFHDSLTRLPRTSDFLSIFLAAVFFGLVALAFIKSLEFMEKLAESINMSVYLKALIGGTALIVLTFVFGQSYLGLGNRILETSLNGQNLPWYSFIIKMLFSDITLAFGGSGGVLAPVFIIGSSSGNLLAHIFGLDPKLYAALGMVGVLAAATNTPISSILLSSEIFGPAILLPAAITSAVSFLINGHNSIYPSQILAMKKSLSLDVETNKELVDVESKFYPRGARAEKLTGLTRGIFYKVKQKGNNFAFADLIRRV